MQHGNIVLRTMQAADFDAILAIQAQSYPANLIESRDALASRHALSPDTCWVAEHGGEVKGYVFAHPWHGDTPPQLNQPLARLPPQHDTLFIHDMALCRSTRGRGIAPRLLARLQDKARERGLRFARLVAVQGAQHYWARHGYRPYPLPAAKLACYGDDATGMVAELAASGAS